MKKMSEEAGVVLSQAKAILGIAHVRSFKPSSGGHPSLTHDEAAKLIFLAGEVQGKLWGEYFKRAMGTILVDGKPMLE
jgi:hypothetical protein